MTKRMVPLADTKPAPARRYHVIGTHSARCKREKHEDYMHGMNECAVGSEKNHCDCKAHWAEDRTSRLGQ